ncbi:MAG: ABC transporter ATP-binding protein [Planctomycetaceae bacterium]|nr:ABC transporter ATP-binding protein [Planctomycetaceae bacterium]
MITTHSMELPADRGDSREICGWLLERLIIESGRHVDRPRVRRAVREATEAYGSLDDGDWWRVLSEASESLGFKSKIIDATPVQTLQLAQDGAMVCWKTDLPDMPWLAVAQSRRSKLQVLLPYEDPPVKWMKPGQLRRYMKLPKHSQTVRCVVLQPYDALGITTDKHTKPFDRLRSLLRPEWSDIWVVMVFALVAGLLTLATPIAVESLVNTVAFGTLLQPVVILAIILFTFLGLQALMRALQTFVVEIIQRRMFARVAADLGYRIPRTRTEAFDDQFGPELVNRFFEVVTLQKVTAQLFLDGVGLVLSTLIGMAVIAFYHPFLLGFDVVLLGLICFTIFVLGRGAIKTSIVESKKKYRMASWLEDLSRCPTAFKTDGGAEFALERTDQIMDDYLRARASHFRILFRQIVFALFLQAVASTVLLGLGGWLVISGQLTLGQLVASELIVTVIVGSFAKLGKHMESFYDLLASVDKLGQLFDLPIERTDGLLTFGKEGPASVKMHHVTYGFPNCKPILNGVSCEIESGARVALTGSPGSGKSTLLDLIQGQRPPSLGHLLIDQIDPRDLRPDVVRRAVSMIRHVEIFEGTIAENIHLERPGVTNQQVQMVLELLGVLETILALPEGLETRLLPSGRPLSETERLLVMVARALVGKPRLLLIDGLLDELPDRAIEEVWDAINRANPDMTVILVTGRDRLVELCDFELDLGSRESDRLMKS